MSQEWLVAGVIVVVPFGLFAVLQLILYARARRQRSVARRAKEIRRR